MRSNDEVHRVGPYVGSGRSRECAASSRNPANPRPHSLRGLVALKRVGDLLPTLDVEVEVQVGPPSQDTSAGHGRLVASEAAAVNVCLVCCVYTTTIRGAIAFE